MPEESLTNPGNTEDTVSSETAKVAPAPSKGRFAMPPKPQKNAKEGAGHKTFANLRTAMSNAERHRSITHYGMYNSSDSVPNRDPVVLNGQIDEKRDWAFVFGSVGDCKVFLYNPSSTAVTDITSSNRTDSESAADCGGRLGPCDRDGKPDLRNLFVGSATVRRNDLILIVSDGVHDNLDPELLGKHPRDIDDEIGRASCRERV